GRLARAPARATPPPAAPLAEAPFLGERALFSHCRNRLPEHMVPSAFVVLEALPLTANGKVDRGALPAVSPTNRPGRIASEAPAGETEQRLASLWCEVLGIESLGRDDNFLDLGGQSLLAAQLSTRIRANFGVELSLPQVLQNSTLATMARNIAQAPTTA